MSDYGRGTSNESADTIRFGMQAAAWNNQVWGEYRQIMVTEILNALANAHNAEERAIVQGKWLAVLTLDAILQQKMENAELERERLKKT